MVNISVPDILSFSRISQNVADLKSRVDTTRTESVTGRYEDVTKQANGDVGGVHIIRKAIDDARLFRENIGVALSRAQVTQTIMSNIGADSSRIATEMTAAIGRDDQAMVNVLINDAAATLAVSFSALNVTFGGRSLFSGDATDRPPLAAPEQLIADIEAIMAGAVDAADAQTQIDFYFNNPAGGFATSIYQGGVNDASSVEIAPGTRVDVSANASDQPIKDMLRGLATVAAAKSATFADVDSVILNGTSTALNAQAVLVDQRAAIGVNEQRLASAIERYETEETILTTLYNDKTLRDPFEAASELQLLETQLEASYLLTARMARLSLANFLR